MNFGFAFMPIMFSIFFLIHDAVLRFSATHGFIIRTRERLKWLSVKNFSFQLVICMHRTCSIHHRNNQIEHLFEFQLGFSLEFNVSKVLNTISSVSRIESHVHKVGLWFIEFSISFFVLSFLLLLFWNAKQIKTNAQEK